MPCTASQATKSSKDLQLDDRRVLLQMDEDGRMVKLLSSQESKVFGFSLPDLVDRGIEEFVNVFEELASGAAGRQAVQQVAAGRLPRRETAI